MASLCLGGGTIKGSFLPLILKRYHYGLSPFDFKEVPLWVVSLCSLMGSNKGIRHCWLWLWKLRIKRLYETVNRFLSQEDKCSFSHGLRHQSITLALVKRDPLRPWLLSFVCIVFSCVNNSPPIITYQSILLVCV